MRGRERLLTLACHAAVIVWIGLYLAGRAPEARELEPAEERSARVEPVAETPPPEPVAEPRPAPGPETPEHVAETGQRPEPIEREDLAAGRSLLDGAGVFPALSCSYADFASFRDYAAAMETLGARFVVVRNRAIAGEIDVQSGRMDADFVAAGFSPRARDYTDAPALAALAREARARFGSGAVIMMLVPRSLDAGLFGAIARSLAERGQEPGDYREIRGRYARSPGGGVRLHVETGVTTDGSRVPLDLLFDLDALARLEAGEGRA